MTDSDERRGGVASFFKKFVSLAENQEGTKRQGAIPRRGIKSRWARSSEVVVIIWLLRHQRQALRRLSANGSLKNFGLTVASVAGAMDQSAETPESNHWRDLIGQNGARKAYASSATFPRSSLLASARGLRIAKAPTASRRRYTPFCPLTASVQSHRLVPQSLIHCSSLSSPSTPHHHHQQQHQHHRNDFTSNTTNDFDSHQRTIARLNQ